MKEGWLNIRCVRSTEKRTRSMSGEEVNMLPHEVCGEMLAPRFVEMFDEQDNALDV